jgi:hypothetical protein
VQVIDQTLSTIHPVAASEHSQLFCDAEGTDDVRDAFAVIQKRVRELCDLAVLCGLHAPGKTHGMLERRKETNPGITVVIKDPKWSKLDGLGMTVSEDLIVQTVVSGMPVDKFLVHKGMFGEDLCGFRVVSINGIPVANANEFRLAFEASEYPLQVTFGPPER